MGEVGRWWRRWWRHLVVAAVLAGCGALSWAWATWEADDEKSVIGHLLVVLVYAVVAAAVRRLASAASPVRLASSVREDAYSSDMTVVGLSSLLERIHRAGGRVDVLGTPRSRASLRQRWMRLVGG